MAEGTSPLKRPTKVYKIKRKVKSCSDISLLPEEALAVADPSSRAVKIFDGEGAFKKVLMDHVHPISVAATRSGLIVFTQKDSRRSNSICLCMMDGQNVGSWGQDTLTKPHAIAISNRGRLVITEVNRSGQYPVALYTQDGQMLHKCHTKRCDPPLESPFFVDVDVYDRIAVTDSTNNCVHVFDSEGKHLFKMGSHGREDGSFRYPQGITTDAKGNFMICDSANRRVSVFSSSGRFIQHLLTPDDGLDAPIAADYSRAGRLVIANNSSSKGSFTKVRAYDIS